MSFLNNNSRPRSILTGIAIAASVSIVALGLTAFSNSAAHSSPTASKVVAPNSAAVIKLKTGNTRVRVDLKNEFRGQPVQVRLIRIIDGVEKSFNLGRITLSGKKAKGYVTTSRELLIGDRIVVVSTQNQKKLLGSKVRLVIDRNPPVAAPAPSNPGSSSGGSSSGGGTNPTPTPTPTPTPGPTPPPLPQNSVRVLTSDTYAHSAGSGATVNTEVTLTFDGEVQRTTQPFGYISIFASDPSLATFENPVSPVFILNISSSTSGLLSGDGTTFEFVVEGLTADTKHYIVIDAGAFQDSDGTSLAKISLEFTPTVPQPE
jgi:hypothetical protein